MWKSCLGSLNLSAFVIHPLVAQYRTHQQLGPDALLPPSFVTAQTINPAKRVLMQATIQRHIDQSLSSTINLPADTLVETVAQIYRQAWEAGCKGITIREETPLGTAFVTINYNADPHEPFEAFLRLGKAGSDLEADAEALGRLISLILRLPSPMSRVERIQAIMGQLEMIGGARSIGFGPARVRSLPDGIARALARYLDVAQNGTPAADTVAVTDTPATNEPVERLLPTTTGDFCPRCRQATLLVSHGCLRCTECGFKEC